MRANATCQMEEDRTGEGKGAAFVLSFSSHLEVKHVKRQNHLYFFRRLSVFFLFLSDITFLSLGQSAGTGEGVKYCTETQTHTHTTQTLTQSLTREPFLRKSKRIGCASVLLPVKLIERKRVRSLLSTIRQIYLNRSIVRRRWRIKNQHVAVTQAECTPLMWWKCVISYVFLFLLLLQSFFHPP